MNNVSRLVVCTVAIMMTAFMPLNVVWSADDNASIAQVYLEFDPATGEFISVPATADNSPDGSMGGMQSTHPATTHDPAVQTQDTAAPQTQPTTQTGGTPVVDTGNAAAGGMSPMLIGSIIAIGLFGGIVLMMRKKSA